jgi:integrase
VLETESDPYSIFIYAMRSPKTREKCIGRLCAFFDFIDIPGPNMTERCKFFCERAKLTVNGWVFANILRFLQHHKERFENKEITAGTIKNYFQAVRLFCDMNDIPVPWKKISKGLLRTRKYADDRAPTLEEIRKIVEYPDRRIKSIVYTMASSGIRVGAWNYLKWKHIKPIEMNGLMAAKLIVYAGEDEEYFTFITPEAYVELQKWKDYRIQSGEDVSNESWVMRNIWNTKKGYTKGLVSAPVKLQSEGVKRLVEDALWTQGVRKKLDSKKKRHEFQTDHGFRKWFKTRCEMSHMESINIAVLMNHSIGISDSYYRPTEKQIFEDYLKAVDSLTVSDEQKLQKEVENVKEKTNEERYILSGKLQEKGQEILSLKEEINSMRDDMNNVLKIAKKNNGKIGRDRTMLDEKGRISFCQDYDDGRILSVKIPIDSVEVGEDQTEPIQK